MNNLTRIRLCALPMLAFIALPCFAQTSPAQRAAPNLLAPKAIANAPAPLVRLTSGSYSLQLQLGQQGFGGAVSLAHVGTDVSVTLPGFGALNGQLNDAGLLELRLVADGTTLVLRGTADAQQGHGEVFNAGGQKALGSFSLATASGQTARIVGSGFDGIKKFMKNKCVPQCPEGGKL